MAHEVPRLNPVVEGVDFVVMIDGRLYRAFVMADVLRERCGASGAGDYLDCYRRHEDDVGQLAQAVYRRVGRDPIVLWEPLLLRLGL